MAKIFIMWIIFCWRLNVKLIQKKVFTVARAFIAFLLIPGLAIADIIATPFIYMFPKTFLPIGTPEMTLDEMVRFLADYSVLNGEQQTNHWILAMKLFKERPQEFWLIQIPFIFLLGFLLVMFYRSGWPYKGKKKNIISDEITHGSSRWRTSREYQKTLTKIKMD